MSTEQEKSESGGGAKKWFLGILGSLVGAVLIAIVTGFISPPGIKAWACQSWDLLGNSFCGESFNHIDEGAAEEFLIRYYSKAGAPGETGGWGFLTVEYQDNLGKEAYIERWSTFSWAEVVSSPKKVEGKFNTFRLDIRHYQATKDAERPRTGRILVYSEEVTLKKANGSPRLDNEVNFGGKPKSTRANYPRGFMPTPHVTYQSALKNEKHIALHLSDQSTEGGTLAILCKLDETDSVVIDQVGRTLGQDDVDLWYRTPDGWIPASAMPNAKTNEVPECDYRYAELPYLSE